jgi:hypothetical protein
MVTLVAFAFAKNAPERRASGHSTAHGHRMKKNRVFRRCNRQTTINARTSDPQGFVSLRILAWVRSDATGWRSTYSGTKRVQTAKYEWQVPVPVLRDHDGNRREYDKPWQSI